MRKTRIRRFLLPVILASCTLALGGCATKRSVQDGMEAQGGRMDDVESQVEANQRALRETGRRLDGVTGDVRAAEQRGDQAGRRADAAYSLARGKLLFKVVLEDMAGTFAFASASLSDEATDRLDEFARKLIRENANVYLEIRGHADSRGPEDYNLRLGLMRAEAVRRYLNGEHEIPLHKMSVISFGESQPVADNGTEEGRARNRRVEIQVLS